jgi:hypothetical protein
MTTANVNVTKVLLKRGNTVQNNNYTGVSGELTIDTQLKTLRVHDGVTAGGNAITATGAIGSYSNTNTAAYLASQSITSANIGAFQTFANANAATQTTSINTVNANVGAYQTYANANAATQTTSIDSINANVGAFQTLANANAATQATSIDSINANVGAYQTFANANAATQTTEINSLRANITAANTAITNLTSNAAIQATLLDTLTGNAATQSQVLDTLTSNAAAQATSLTTLLGNAVAQQTSLIDLVANAATQAQAIASVTGTYSNANVSTYLSAFDGNILPAANVTYSLGSSTRQWRDLWVSNNTIYIGNTPVRVDGGTLLVNGAPVGGSYNNANVAAYLPTYTGNIAGNIVKNGNVWTFGTNGTTTFPTNISVDYSGGNVQFPRIIADSGKAFSVQGQGNVGSAALSWTVNPDAAGQYAAVAVTKGGGDNLAKVILQAQSDSGDAATAKIWRFNQTGTTQFPNSTILAPAGQNITMQSDQYSQLMWENANLTVAPDMAINSNFYVAQNSATLDIGYRDGSSTQIIKSWLWSADGSLTLPSGGTILESTYLSADSIILKPDGGTSTQYLEIAPTAVDGNHIHLMAGSGTELFLGDDNHYVKLANTGGVVINSNDSAGNTAQWTFGAAGTTTLPAGGTITEGGGISGAIRLTPAGGANSNQALLIYPTGNAEGDHVHLTAGGGSTELYLGNDLHYVKLVDGGNIELRAATANLSSQAAWTFDTTGNVDTIQALGIKVPNGVPSNVAVINSTTGSWEANPRSNLATTGGSGTGLTVNVTETGGYASTIAIATAGTGYNNGDLITVTSGTSNATFTIVIGGRNTWRFGTNANLTLPETGYLRVGSGIVAGFASSPAPVISGFSSISAENFRFQGNGVNILSDLYANAAVQSANIATLFSNAATQATNIATINNTLTSTNVAIGYGAGQTNQGGTTVAIGSFAGMDAQGLSAVAIGFNAGQTTQGIKSVAIGMTAGYSVQGNGAVAIGDSAGYTNQGVQAIAIGRFAGLTNQANNSIILNATGANLNATTANTFIVAPVRNDVANVAQVMFYNTTSKEITYGNTISVAGNINANQYNFANGVNILSTVGAGAYSNTQVAAYLLNFDGDIEFTSSTARIGNVDVITVMDSIRSPAYQFSNGVSILAGITATANTGNITFSDTTIGTAGGAGQGIILNSAGSGEIAMLDYVGINNTNPGYWLHVGDGSIGAINNTGNISIDYNNGLDSSRAATILGYAWWDAGSNGNNNRGIGAHRQFGIYKNDDLYTTKYIEFDLTSGNANLTNIAVTRVTTTNGVYWANGVNYASTVTGTYSNTNVAAYLTTATITTTGNITAGNLTTSGTFTVANITTTGTYGNITGANVVSANTVSATNYLFANGVNILSTVGGTYSNANVVANLANYVSNIVSTANVTASYFVGNGSALTGITANNTGNIYGTSSNVTLVAGSYNWAFDNTGNLTLPGNTFAVNYANTAPVNVVTRFESTWTVPTGNSTQSFTVSPSETYYMWVDCNIPNGILAWNATATITNSNVPVVGAQYAWVYTGGGTPIDFTSIPNQFTGTANTIVRSSVAPSATTNRFDFGINNASGGNVTVRYGWIAIS